MLFRYIRRKTDEDVERVRAACADMSQRDSLAARDARDAAQAEALRQSQHASEVQVRCGKGLLGAPQELFARDVGGSVGWMKRRAA